MTSVALYFQWKSTKLQVTHCTFSGSPQDYKCHTVLSVEVCHSQGTYMFTNTGSTIRAQNHILARRTSRISEQAAYDVLPGIEGSICECPGRVEALTPLDPVGTCRLQLGIERVHEDGRVKPVRQVLST